MEVPSTLFQAILGGWVFPYISRIHTAYIGVRSSILRPTSMFGDRNSSILWRTFQDARSQNEGWEVGIQPKNVRIFVFFKTPPRIPVTTRILKKTSRSRKPRDWNPSNIPETPSVIGCDMVVGSDFAAKDFCFSWKSCLRGTEMSGWVCGNPHAYPYIVIIYLHFDILFFI